MDCTIAPRIVLPFLLTALVLWLGPGCPTDPDDDDQDDDDATADDDDSTDTDDDDTVDPETLDPQRIFDDVAYLASDELEGRAPGSEGNEMALEYVEGVFDDYGLVQAGQEQTFRQYFPLEQWSELAPPSLVLGGVGLVAGTDFIVFQYSGSGQVSGEVVFAGYGMTVPPFDVAQYPDCPLDPAGYDDYAGLDLTDKVALVVRHGPQDDETIHDECPANEAALGLPALWNFGYKAANARLHGASAMLLINHYGNPAEAPEGYLGGNYYQDDFPALGIHRSPVETWLPELPAWVSQIDLALAPNGRPTGLQASLDVDAAIEILDVPNVVAALPGADPDIGSEVIVVGAHLDHVGMDLGSGEVFNGADDNASGTAVMLELARMLGHSGYEPARTVVFAGWNAEELGLVGSCYYVGDPAFPMEDVILAISVDMVGAGDGTGLNLFGSMVPEDAWFAELMAASATDQGLAYDVLPGPPTFNSDHACFSFAGTTGVMALTLGPHSDYHTPADTIDGILIEDLEAAARLVWAALEPLARGEEGAYLDRSAPPTASSSESNRPRAIDLARDR